MHLVTDLCEGGELFHKIVEKSSHSKSSRSIDGVACFTEGEAARIMYQILNAVCYMHHHDVVHRDLKPENILFETADAYSPVKIVDFGLARKHAARDAPMSNIAQWSFEGKMTRRAICGRWVSSRMSCCVATLLSTA